MKSTHKDLTVKARKWHMPSKDGKEGRAAGLFKGAAATQLQSPAIQNMKSARMYLV